ncbi:ERF family protein [Streptomyces griseofuscus]|uniref:ERF family protein n=1 Tax=Streptomyces griseofuscus TaxID=146922 RepID=UPI00340F6584
MAEPTADNALTVDQAMIAVMREIGPVGKNGRNRDQGYSFRAQEDIVAAARAPMAKYGLRMLPKVISHEHFTRGKVNVAIIEVEYTFRGPAGDEMPPILVIGEGADVSDKASNKAMTAAKKYAYIQAFEIADGADDGDRDHPAAVRGPLDWYIEQIRQPGVWQNPEALRRLRDRAVGENVADHRMPDSQQTFRQVIEAQGRSLLAQQQEREQRRAEERQAAQAQMAAEYPDPPDPYEDAWAQPGTVSATPPPAPAPEPQWETPASGWPESAPEQQLPDAATVEGELATALADPQTAEDHLHALRARYSAAVLAQIVVRTEWGTVDANSAITMALMSVGQAPETDPAPSPEPKQPATAAEEQPAARRPAPRRASMSAEDRARANMIAEVEFQAQMLGLSTLEFVADLLPEGASSVEDIRGGSRLQDHIRAHRAQVLGALAERKMMRAAEAYAEFGDRVPARNINEFISTVLQAR